MQAIETAVHRWDAENAVGAAGEMDLGLAVDAVAYSSEVMVPAGRLRNQPPAGEGETYRFRQTDGAGDWFVVFDGGDVRMTHGGATPADVEIAGTASQLMLFLLRRLPASELAVTGDRNLVRYAELAPSV